MMGKEELEPILYLFVEISVQMGSCSVIEKLTYMCEALGSIPAPEREKQRDREIDTQGDMDTHTERETERLSYRDRNVANKTDEMNILIKLI
jgi:hypothetical protein